MWCATCGAGRNDLHDVRIDVLGRHYIFDHSDRFGPLLVKKNGAPCVNQPISEKHPFWKGFMPWLRQGKRVVDGVAVWEIEPEKAAPRLRHLGGNHYEILHDEGDA